MELVILNVLGIVVMVIGFIGITATLKVIADLLAIKNGGS